MKAKFRAEIRYVKKIADEVAKDYRLPTAQANGKTYYPISVTGQDGSVTAEYPETQPIMALIGRMAELGEENLEAAWI